MHLLDNAAEFADVDADVLTDLGHFGAQIDDLVARAFDERLPATTGFLGHTVKPVRVQLIAAIFLNELATVDAGLVRQLYQRAVDRHDLAVDAVKLVDQGLNPVVVQVKRVHQFNNLGAQFLIGLFFACRERVILHQGRRHPQILHLGQLAIVARDQVQRFQHARLKRGFHRSQRHVGLLIIVVVVVVDRVAVGVQLGLAVLFFLGGGIDVQVADNGLFVLVVFHRTAKGRIKVDHIAQQNLFVQKFVAPDRDRLKGQRALAEAQDHGVAAGLDPFRDGDFALTRQQFDRAHFAQVHTHRIVGPVQLFGLGGRYGDFARA